MKPGRLLVVDDSEVERSYLSTVLRQIGHAVVACDDSEGWDRLFCREERYDVVILDMIMPLSGLEFIREIVRRRFTVQVIGVSGGAGDKFEELLDAEKSIASAILTKPVEPGALKEALGLLLANRP